MSRDYRGKKIVIYPEYLDSRLSRSEGRRINKELAIPNPRIDEIVKAAEKLGLNPIVEADASYPRNWWEHRGRVIVDKIGSKLNTLKEIAKILKQTRKK